MGRLPRNKRAIVTLAEGYGITIYPQEDTAKSTLEEEQKPVVEESDSSTTTKEVVSEQSN